MNLFAISGLVTFISSLAFGIFSWVKGRRFLNKIWAIFNLSVALWGWGAFKFSTSLDQKEVFFWLRFGHIGVIFIPVLFLHFVFEFLELKKKRSVGLIYIIGISFTILNITDWAGLTNVFIVGLRYVFNSFYVDSPPGPAYPFFVGFFAVSVIYAHYHAFKYLRVSAGLKRMQVKYFLLATAIGFGGGSTAFFMVFNVDIYPVWHFAVCLYPVIMTYAIFRYRLMDIDLAVRGGLSFICYALVSLAIFLPLIVLAYGSLVPTVFTVMLAISVSPILFRFFQKYARALVDKLVFHGKFGYLDRLERLWDDDGGEHYTSYQIASKLVEEIAFIMGIKSAAFFLYNNYCKSYRPLVQIGMDDVLVEPIGIPSFKKEDGFIRQLADTKRPVLKENEAVFPFFVEDRLTGILILAGKSGGEMFHHEDIKALARQIKIAENHLSHTVFMEERASFSRKLAHDMKNLFTKAIEPTIQDFLEADGREQKEKILKTIVSQLNFLKVSLKDNFDLVSILERLVRQTYYRAPYDLKTIVRDSISLYKVPFDEKGLSIRIDIAEGLPKVLVNKDDIPKVFNNLLDNSLKFTEKGSISITAEVKGGEVLVRFSDTGLGIEKSELEYIFEPMTKMPYRDGSGTGLGITIVRDIIDAHKGKIWVESEYNKGTSFYFTLPAA